MVGVGETGSAPEPGSPACSRSKQPSRPRSLVMIRRALIASMSTVLLGLGSLLTGPELSAQRLRDARAGISMPGFSNPALFTVPHTRPELPREDTGKSPILAGVLSFYIPGVGSFYAGNY